MQWTNHVSHVYNHDAPQEMWIPDDRKQIEIVLAHKSRWISKPSFCHAQTFWLAMLNDCTIFYLIIRIEYAVGNVQKLSYIFHFDNFDFKLIRLAGIILKFCIFLLNDLRVFFVFFHMQRFKCLFHAWCSDALFAFSMQSKCEQTTNTYVDIHQIRWKRTCVETENTNEKKSNSTRFRSISQRCERLKWCWLKIFNETKKEVVVTMKLCLRRCVCIYGNVNRMSFGGKLFWKCFIWYS